MMNIMYNSKNRVFGLFAFLLSLVTIALGAVYFKNTPSLAIETIFMGLASFGILFIQSGNKDRIKFYVSVTISISVIILATVFSDSYFPKLLVGTSLALVMLVTLFWLGLSVDSNCNSNNSNTKE